MTQPRFAETFCSQCGQGFGPGEHGFSHCDDHPGWKRDRKLKRQAAAQKGAATRRRLQIMKANREKEVETILQEMRDGPRIKTDLKDWTGSPRFSLDKSPKVKGAS